MYYIVHGIVTEWSHYMILCVCVCVCVCLQPLSAADYLQLCRNFTTLFLQDVPQLTLHSRTEARRFITLIDNLYDNRVRPLAELVGVSVHCWSDRCFFIACGLVWCVYTIAETVSSAIQCCLLQSYAFDTEVFYCWLHYTYS